MIAAHLRRAGVHHVFSDTDANGDPIRDPDSGDVVARFLTAEEGGEREVRCEVRQQQSRENRQGGIVVTTEWVGLFRPPGMRYGIDAFGASDEVSVPDVGRFAIEGDPYLERQPSTQRATHWFVRLRRVT